jgi:DNA-binding transcriptional regulator YbjK
MIIRLHLLFNIIAATKLLIYHKNLLSQTKQSIPVKSMTCYFRHLEALLKTAGITVTAENRQELDRVIHQLVGVDYKNCPATWRQIKHRLTDNQEAFVLQLKTGWENST